MENQIKVAVAQLGARQNYTVPIALQNLGYLERFYTDIYLNSRETALVEQTSRTLNCLSPYTSKLLSRHNRELNFHRVRRFNLLGLSYLQALNRSSTTTEKYRAFMHYGKAFNKDILQDGLPEVTHLYGFDHSALDLFQKARDQGINCILDQIYAGPEHEIIAQEEEDRWSDWLIELSNSAFYQSKTLQQWHNIQLQEWELADTIIAASEYTRRGIVKVAPTILAKIKVIPLTVDIRQYLPYQHLRHYPPHRALKVLFVGRVSILKGIPYLLKAFEQIKPTHAQLTVVGSIEVNPNKIAPYQDRVHFQGPVPHVQMPQIYHDADLFIFPTISDGFGAVMLEAMATGLPVIATDNCSDLVEDGVNGYRIPIRESEAIVAKIDHLRQQPQLLKELSQGAMATSQRYNIEAYQSKLAQIFQQDLDD